MSDYPQSDDELRMMTDGCTELTCIYHGEFNRELRRRQKSRSRIEVADISGLGVGLDDAAPVDE